MPPAPDAPGPAADARRAETEQRMQAGANATASMPAPSESVARAAAALAEPPEQTAGEAAEAATVEVLETAAPSPRIQLLCTPIVNGMPLIYFTIHAKRPEEEGELLRADPRSMAAEAGSTLDDDIEAQESEVREGYDGLESAPSGEAPPPPDPLETPPTEVETPTVDATAAAPDAIPDEDIDLDADVRAQRRAMDDAGMQTEPAQLVADGPIADARAAQQELSETAASRPTEVRVRQQQTLDEARAAMARLQTEAQLDLGRARTQAAGGTALQQQEGVQTEQSMRAAAGRQMQAAYDGARTFVETKLGTLQRIGMQQWEAESDRLSTEFRDHLDTVQRWVDERHESWGAAAWDWVTGLPDWVTEHYDRAEIDFVHGVCEVLLRISRQVNTIIQQCEGAIQAARARITEIVASLPAELKDWGAGEAERYAEQLAGLQQQVVETRDRFDEQLTGAAIDAVQEVKAEVEALREAAQGLIGQIADAITEFLDDPVRAIVNGLLNAVGISPPAFWALVQRIGEVAEQIADDPESFVNNLMAALKQGFDQFLGNFGQHLLGAFVDWLFSAMGSVGVQVPGDFSLRSVITFFLQLMGITWSRIRRLLAKHIGEENVELIERAWQLVSTLIQQGPEGIFEMIKEQLDPQALLDMVIQAAVDYIVQAVVEAATARILMLFNPVGAILQAIEAIYRVASWIFENAARIFSLVETVVNGIGAILAGDIGGMANAIEQALAGLLMPVIDFVAGYAGLGDLPERVADLVRGLQARVEAILDRVIGWLADRARALLARLGFGDDEEEQADEGEGAEEDDGVGRPVPFAGHRLYFREVGERIELIVASTPQPIGEQLQAWQRQLDDEDGWSPDDEARAQGLLDRAASLAGVALDRGRTEDRLEDAAEQDTSGGGDAQAADAERQTVAAEEDLAAVLEQLFGLFGDENTFRHAIVALIGQRLINRGAGANGEDHIALTLPADVQQDYFYNHNGGVCYIQRKRNAANSAPVVHVDAEGVLREGTASGRPDHSNLERASVVAAVARVADGTLPSEPAQADILRPLRPASGDWVAVFATGGRVLTGVDAAGERFPATIRRIWAERGGRSAARMRLVRAILASVGAAPGLAEQLAADGVDLQFEAWQVSATIIDHIIDTPLTFVSGTDIPRRPSASNAFVRVRPGEAVASSLYHRVFEAASGALLQQLQTQLAHHARRYRAGESEAEVVAEIHHGVPLYLGGSHGIDNLVPVSGRAAVTGTAHEALHELIDSQAVRLWIDGRVVDARLSNASLRTHIPPDARRVIIGVLFKHGSIDYQETALQLDAPEEDSS